MGWKTTQNRKKQQRAVNAVVRWMNKDIYNDPMWKPVFIFDRLMYDGLDMKMTIVIINLLYD